MKNAKTSIELKTLAKCQLTGRYGIAIAALCIAGSISLILNFLTNRTSDLSSPSGFLFYYLMIAAIQIFLSIFTVGEARLYLNIACNYNPTVTDIFYGFKNHTDKVIIFNLISLAAYLIFMIPSIICTALSSFTGNIIFLLISTLFFILGTFATIIFSLVFSQTIYLIVDLPKYTILEVMKMSAHIMTGHKARLFYIIISFIGLSLLSMLTCFIGNLWLIPYINATKSNFYLDLMSLQNLKSHDL